MVSSQGVNVDQLNPQSSGVTSMAAKYQASSFGKVSLGRHIKGNPKLEKLLSRMCLWLLGWRKGFCAHPFFVFLGMQLTGCFYLQQYPEPRLNLLKSDNILFKYLLPCFQKWHI